MPNTNSPPFRLLRHSAGPLDQGLFALSNLILVLSVARDSTVAEFGQFSIWYSVFLFAQSLVRANVGMPAIVGAGSQLRDAAGGTAAVLMIAVGLTPIAVAVAVTFDTTIALYLAATAAAIVADSCRYLSFSNQQPVASLAIDATWLVVQLLGLTLLGTGLERGIALWATGALVGVSAWAVSNRLLRNLISVGPKAASTSLLRLGRGQRIAYNSEALITSGLRQVLNWVALAVFGLAAAAALRGGFTAFGPVLTASLGLRLAAIPRLKRMPPDKRLTISLTLGASTGLLALATGAGLFLLPGEVGELALGESWAPTRAILVPCTLTVLFWSLDNSAFIFHGSSGSVSLIAQTKLVAALAQLAGVLVGAALGDGVIALMYGLAIGSFGGTVVWMLSIRSKLEGLTPLEVHRNETNGPGPNPSA